ERARHRAAGDVPPGSRRGNAAASSTVPDFMDDPEVWRWIWLVAAAAFFAGELASPGSFFLLPIAIGAAVASVLAFLDVNVGVEAVVFLVVSVVVFGAMRPLARRLDREGVTLGVGARRLIGEPATVVEAIPAGPHEL